MLHVKITGVKELSQKMNRLQKGIPRAGNKSIRKALKVGKRIAKSFAPVYSGELRAGIRRKTITKKGNIISGTLISTVPKSFPYHYWVNETTGFKYTTLARKRTRSGRWPTRAVRNRWPKIYTKRWLYRNTKHTGVPGYFDKAVKIMEQKYPKIVLSEVRNTIKRSGFK